MKKIVKILKKPFTSTVIAVLCGFIVAAVILSLAGYNPWSAFGALFKGIFSKPKYISNVIIKATPIILTGISVAFAFKTGLFNIGAEGQYIAGTIASVIVGSMLDLPSFIQIPIVILSGVIAGALIGYLIGFLKAKFGIHEVITSIMFNWIMLYLCNFVVQSASFHQPNSTSSIKINKSSYTMILGDWKRSEEGMAALSNTSKWFREIILKTDINVGIIVAIIIAIVIWILLYKSSIGYELRAVGFNKDAAEFAGINVKKSIILSMVIAGAISGLAGALIITGMEPHRISILATFENYGFNGLSVALIAGSSPIGCIFSGLLFGGLLYGGQSIQLSVGAPSEIINIIIGTIVFFVALTKVVPYLAEKLEREGEKNVK